MPQNRTALVPVVELTKIHSRVYCHFEKWQVWFRDIQVQ